MRKELTKWELELCYENTRRCANAILAYPHKNIPRDKIKSWFDEYLKELDTMIKKCMR